MIEKKTTYSEFKKRLSVSFVKKVSQKLIGQLNLQDLTSLDKRIKIYIPLSISCLVQKDPFFIFSNPGQPLIIIYSSLISICP